MKKLIVSKIDDYQYVLKETANDKIYRYSLEFYNLDKKLKIGDYIFVHDELLQERNQLLCFDTLNSKYGRKINSSFDKDLIVLMINNEKIYLKRVYG